MRRPTRETERLVGRDLYPLHALAGGSDCPDQLPVAWSENGAGGDVGNGLVQLAVSGCPEQDPGASRRASNYCNNYKHCLH